MGIMLFANGQTRFYWVGGTGSWSDPTKWADSSGGGASSAGRTQRLMDIVVFDSNSFKNSTIPRRVLADTIVCNSMFWTDIDSLVFFQCPYVYIGDSLELHKNVQFLPNITFNFTSKYFYSTIKTNGVHVDQMIFNGTDLGKWTLLDPLTVNYCSFLQGNLNFGGQYVQIINDFTTSGANNRRLNIENSEIDVGCKWQYGDSLSAKNSIIYTNQMYAGLTTKYHDVILRCDCGRDRNCNCNYDTDTASIFLGIYNKVHATCHSKCKQIETDTLILSNAKTYVYQFQDTIKVNKAFYGNGNPCGEKIYLQSLIKCVPAIFDINSACANLPNTPCASLSNNTTILIDYVYVHGIRDANHNLKKGQNAPDVPGSDTSRGYGIFNTDSNCNQNWAAMEAYEPDMTLFIKDKDAICKRICLSDLPYTVCPDNLLPSYGTTFEWKKNANLMGTTPYYVLNDVTDSGTYYLTVTYGDGCQRTDSICIILTYFKVDTIMSETCENSNGKIILTAVNATEPITYEWNRNGNLWNTNPIDSLKAGTYDLHFADADGICNIDTSFTVDSIPTPIISDTIIRPEKCDRKDGEITIIVKNEDPNKFTYQWTKFNNSTLTWEELSDTINIITGLDSGTYFVKITNFVCDTTATFTVPYIAGPVANFVTDSYYLSADSSFTLTDDTKGTPEIWNWDMGDGTTDTGKIVSHSYNTVGKYVVLLEVTDTNGCMDSISKLIQVHKELIVHIPNTFSPNSDRLNDRWKPMIWENVREGYILTIYDRWGQCVFHTTNPDASWDGTINGKPAQNNTVYSYRLIVRDITGNDYEYVGHVTMIR